MISKNDILERFNDLYQRRLKERKKKYLGVGHLNCKFNRRNRIKDHGMLGFCGNDKVTSKLNRKLFLCNDDEVAEGCDKFVCKNTEESVESDFNEIIKSPSRCGQEYPKLAVLIWILQEDGIAIGKENIPTGSQDESGGSLFGVEVKKVGYWKNIINAMMKR